MPKIITEQQVGLYRERRKQGDTQEKAAARAGFSERTGRNIENDMRVLKTDRKRYATNNPLDKIFDKVIVPLLEKHDCEATFLLRHVQKLHPGEYPDSLLRSLQRRIKAWKERCKEVKDKEVMFPQKHTPGKLAACDFTHPKDKVTVTINGRPFRHIIFHLRLPYSGLSYAQVFEGCGESFEKLAQGLNNGFEYLGGVPEVLRTDSMSAAFKNLNKEGKKDYTRSYEALINHYGLVAQRINKGKPHENGSIESSHGHLKDSLRQMLALRGSNNFCSVDEYQAFVLEVVNDRNNRCNKELVNTEQVALRPLPPGKAVEYTEITALVPSTSIIHVKRAAYTVPSKLIGGTLLVKLFSDKLDCYLAQDHVATLKRVYGSSQKEARNIDPRHLVKWLMRKPRAFRNYAYRDDLLKNHKYKQIWECVDQSMEDQAACKFMTRLLNLAYTHNCEEELADDVIDRIQKNKKLDVRALEDKYMPERKLVHEVKTTQHGLDDYNKFIRQRGA